MKAAWRWVGAVMLAATSSPIGADFGPYSATVIRVVDADTIEVDAAIWPGLTYRTMVRLDGVNAPEMRAQDQCEREAARAAKAFSERFLQDGGAALSGVRPDKYGGRVIGRLAVDGRDLSMELLLAGHAREYHGERRGPWCRPGAP